MRRHIQVIFYFYMIFYYFTWKGKEAVLMKTAGMQRVKTPIQVRSPLPRAPEGESQVAAAGKYENRGYMSVSIGGGVYSALYDPGATCSEAGPELGERFANRLKLATPGYTRSTERAARY